MPAPAVGPQPPRPHRRLPGDAERRRSASGWSRRACASSGCRSEDIEAYLASGEWRGKAGGYAAQGIAGTFIVKIVGSYTQRRRPAALRDDDAAWRARAIPIRFGWLNAV